LCSKVSEADCLDFYSWRESQDALESDSSLQDHLDDDLDGIACNELAQTEYEDAWAIALTERARKEREGCPPSSVGAPDPPMGRRERRSGRLGE